MFAPKLISSIVALSILGGCMSIEVTPDERKQRQSVYASCMRAIAAENQKYLADTYRHDINAANRAELFCSDIAGDSGLYIK